MTAPRKTSLDAAREKLRVQMPGFVNVEVPVVEPPDPAPSIPFPSSALPKVIEDYVCGSAEALNVDLAFVGVSILGVLAGAIGNRFALVLKSTWRVPAVLWVGIVARSGSRKSPALDRATAPLRLALARIEGAARVERRRFEADLAAWKKGGEEPDAKPEEPRCLRLLIDDATAEATAALLADNPAGLLMVKDELSGWVGNLDRYASGKATSEPFWLSCHGARSHKVDRKGVEGKRPTPIDIARAAVSVVGCMTPGTRSRLIGSAQVASGFLARLLFVDLKAGEPDRWDRPHKEVPTREVEAIFDRLLGAAYDPSKGPRDYKLGASANAVWGEWHDEAQRSIAQEPDEGFASILSKLEELPARIALILQVAIDAQGFDFGKEVSADTMRAAVAIGRWFLHEQRRSYDALTEMNREAEEEKMLAWMRRKEEGVTSRDLRLRSRSRYPTPADAEKALDGLVSRGVAILIDCPPGRGGGPATRRYRPL